MNITAFSKQVNELLSNLAIVSIKKGESKEDFMNEVEKIYDDAKWLMNGIG